MLKLAKKLLNPFYFTDRLLHIGFNKYLDSDYKIHTNSKLTIKANYSQIGIEATYVNKIMREMAISYPRPKTYCIIKYQTVCSAKFDKQDQGNQVLVEIELNFILNINNNVTESDNSNIDFETPLNNKFNIKK